MRLDWLTTVATAARSVMEDCSSSPGELMFRDFPRGTCGPTCEIVGRYFVEILGSPAVYVSAEKDRGFASWTTHAWLLVDNAVVDVTADQFGCAPVIVCPASEWHAQWKVDECRPPITSPAYWPDYPLRTWDAFVLGMADRGITRSGGA